MTDDQLAFRTYAAAALTGVMAYGIGDVKSAKDVSDVIVLIADAMLAEEKKRFPANRQFAAGFAYDVKVAIDPLAGSPDADNEDKNGSYTQ